jgi:Na+-transporting methylmalonyl-CoA/oxaloacetate decarboxylase gamma subunit
MGFIILVILIVIYLSRQIAKFASEFFAPAKPAERGALLRAVCGRFVRSNAPRHVNRHLNIRTFFSHSSSWFGH